jgi:hypothetical protein
MDLWKVVRGEETVFLEIIIHFHILVVGFIGNPIFMCFFVLVRHIISNLFLVRACILTYLVHYLLTWLNLTRYSSLWYYNVGPTTRVHADDSLQLALQLSSISFQLINRKKILQAYYYNFIYLVHIHNLD